MHRDEQADRIEQLLDVERSRVAVLLVDFQRDFCGDRASGGGATGTVGNLQAAVRANEFASEAVALGVRVIYSQQLLDLDRLTPRQRRWEQDSRLCVAGSVGAELFVEPVPGSRVVVKHRLDVWQSQQFLNVLAEWDIDGLVIAGCELQACVLYAVLGANERGFHYVVAQDLVSGMDACETTCNRRCVTTSGSCIPASHQPRICWLDGAADDERIRDRSPIGDTRPACGMLAGPPPRSANGP